jgi:hypothetical protein
VHFAQRWLERVRGAGLRPDPRTFRADFRAARHFRQTRAGYNTRLAVVHGIPIVYRPGGEAGNRVVLVTAYPPGQALPPVVPASPPPERETDPVYEWEGEEELAGWRPRGLR